MRNCILIGMASTVACPTWEFSRWSLEPLLPEPPLVVVSASGFFMVRPSSSSSSSSSSALSSPQSSFNSSSSTLTTGWLQSKPPALSLPPQAGAGGAGEPQSKPPWVPFSTGWLEFRLAFDDALLRGDEPDFLVIFGIFESTSRAKTGQPTYKRQNYYNIRAQFGKTN